MPYHPNSRSRSPKDRLNTASARQREHPRDRSPHRHPRRDDGKHSRLDRHSRTAADQPHLPLDAVAISKHDLRRYRPLFALYLDVQKRLDIDDLPEDEVKGRWKSFVGKWNRGELAEGWYDPTTFQKALNASLAEKTPDKQDRDAASYSPRNEQRSSPNQRDRQQTVHDDDDEDDFGPALPHELQRGTSSTLPGPRSGPAIPTLQDLRARDEQQEEDRESARQQQINDLRADRRSDRRTQKERLDDLVPRAEAGSRERMLENKRLAADANRQFASSAHAGGDVELKDSDIMGDEDGISDLKRMRKEQERKKNEREMRREEILRARIAEREERVKGLREKENKTMDMLKKIAQARFGGGGNG